MSLQRWRQRANKLWSHPKPLRFLASRVLWQARISQLLTMRLADGIRLRFYPSSISAALWVEQGARDEDANFLKLVLRPGDHYIDCGANIGHLAVVARNIVGPSGSAIAIEPNPRIYQYCVGNLELNAFRDVHALNIALGEEDGTVTISDQRADDQNRVGEGKIVVPMRRLDDVSGAGRIALLKIDVEGYELQALRGARQTLERTLVVYCELSASNAHRFGYTPGDIEQLLLDSGFVLAHARDNEWVLAERGVYNTRTSRDEPRTGYNLIAIKQSALSEIRTRLELRGHRLVGHAG